MKAISMEKAYNHEEEKSLYETWDKTGLFKAENDSSRHPFSMILPPLNVMGILHMEHALTFIIPDIINRRKKMQGFNCLWLPGPSHAGIAVRPAAEHLGLSLDWSRMKSSPSDEIQKMVTNVFVRLYNEGEIYRGPDHSRRTETTVEKPISKKWFLRTSRIARPASDMVKREKILFFPAKWKKEYLHWTDNIQDWCISSQSGEGQRIPAFYCGGCNHLMVAEESPVSCEKCGCTRITQDTDVSAPWFSSILWPFTAMGRENNSIDFEEFYPTSLLTVGSNIFFSYLTQAIIIGVHFRKNIPVREILINGLIRDEKGRKMSKSKNNTVDPLEIIDKYGSDALRFTLAVQAVPGMDIALSVNRIKGYRAFANKIWNASRYVLMNLEGDEDFNIDFAKTTDTDRWILNGLNNTVVKLNDMMESYKIYKAADLLYHFFRHEYCDWYLEFSKNDIHNLDTRKTLIFTLFRLMQLTHPFMPYITENIYGRIKADEKRFLLQTEFPSFNSELAFTTESSHVELLKKIIMETRKTRTENRVVPNRKVNVFLGTESQKERKIVEKNIKYFNSLTKSAKTEIVSDFSDLSRGFRGVCPNWEILLPFDSEKDRLNELARLKKEGEKLDHRIAGFEKKLSNENFIDKAPERVVSDFKKNLQESIDKRNKIRKTIDDLS